MTPASTMARAFFPAPPRPNEFNLLPPSELLPVLEFPLPLFNVSLLEHWVKFRPKILSLHHQAWQLPEKVPEFPAGGISTDLGYTYSKAHMWLTSSCWAEVADRAVQSLMGQRRPGLSGKTPPTRNQRSRGKDQTVDRGP